MTLAVWLVATGLAQQAPPTFRGSVQSVPVYATVRDTDGRLVGNLRQQDFAIFDNGKPVVITTFSNEIVPITVALLLDMSVSMAGQFARVRDSALHFVNGLLPADRVRVGTLGTEVSLSPLLTSDKPTLRRILQEELWPGGHTPLWRAAIAAMTSLAPETGRRVILVLTDGGDDCAPSRWSPNVSAAPCATEDDVRKQALDQGFIVYAIGMEGGGLDKGIISIADETGGGYFKLARNANLTATFETVADELHHQYLLAFNPAVLDGKTHSLEVRLSREGLVARARRSYVATGEK